MKARIGAFLRHRPGLGPVAGLATTVSTLLQLLQSPVLGLADNGDFKRLLRPLGLVARIPPGAPQHFQYVWLKYPSVRPVGSSYYDTEFELIRVVRRLSVTLGAGPVFDLRWVGVAHALLLGVAAWLIVRALPGALPVRAVSAVLLVLALTDTRFVVYLNSFYTEPAGLLAMLFLIAAVLHSWRRPTLTLPSLAAVTLSGLALILSKSQHAPLLVPMAAVLLARRVAWVRLRLDGRWRGRIPGAVCAAALVVAGVSYLHAQPAGLARINRYNAVFVELLGHSRNPARDLADLGLSPALARYAGLPIYSPRNATRDPHFADFYRKATDAKLVEFYVTHPGRALALAHRGATASMYLTPVGVSPPLGNETWRSGAAPSYAACRLCLYSKLSQNLRGASGFLLPALWLGALAAALALLYGRSCDAAERGLAVVLLLLVAVAAFSMAVALIGEGAFEIVKHLYLTSACNALLVVLTLHAAALLVTTQVSRLRWSRGESNP